MGHVRHAIAAEQALSLWDHILALDDIADLCLRNGGEVHGTTLRSDRIMKRYNNSSRFLGDAKFQQFVSDTVHNPLLQFFSYESAIE